MSFLNPIALWGPLAALAIALPVVIHLLSRFRPKPMEWAAMELLRRALVVRARRVRLEDLLLMALRAAALGLVALALARPTLVASTSQWIGSSKVGVLVAIDGSFSMAHQPGVTKSRFEHAVARAREILATLSTGDTVTLVVLGQRPRVLLRNVGYDSQRVDETLKSLEPLAEPLGTEYCLNELTQLIDEMKSPAKECYLITDAQATTWGNLSEAASNSLTRLRGAGTVFFLPAGPRNAENVAVARLALASGMPRKGAIARFHADVRNFGRLEARNLSVKLLIDDVETDKTTVETLAPGETRTLAFFAPFKKAGTFAVAAVIEGNDPLAVDNRRFLVANVRDRVNVLCVDGSPSADRLGGETGILSLALTAAARQSGASASPDAGGGVSVKTVSADDFRAADLATYDMVCLAGVKDLPYSETVGLTDFVRRGGGLVVFLGHKTERSAMNGLRGSDGTPLLPAELGDFVGQQPRAGDGASPAAGWSLSTDIPAHPVTDVFARMPREQWTGIRFWRYAKATPREDSQVLLRLEPSQDPLLIGRRLGRGKAYLFTSSANRDWTDMIVNPAYLMMVQQMLTDLTRKSYEAPLTVGESISLEVAADDSRGELPLRAPQGDDVAARIVERGGVRTAVLEHVDQTGVYTVLAAGSDRAVQQRVAVNVDTNESAVTVLRDAELGGVVQRLSLRLVPEKQAVRSAVTESRQGRELWRILLVAALALLVTESLLARLFTRRVSGTTEVYSRRAVAI